VQKLLDHVAASFDKLRMGKVVGSISVQHSCSAWGALAGLGWEKQWLVLTVAFSISLILSLSKDAGCCSSRKGKLFLFVSQFAWASFLRPSTGSG
jgi:hypothetical protein